jgi:hypothetical protein
MTIETKTKTQAILAEMLIENTGRHALDSGDHYGRHWQRHNGKSLDDFLVEPSILGDRWGVSINVFHYLSRRLEFSADVQDLFDKFLELNPDDGHFELARDFAERIDASGAHEWNTYNGECLLSQTIQGVSFQYQSQPFVLLQIHGGADVRGGYTKPRAFRVVVSEGSMFPYDHADYSAECPTSPDHFLTNNGGYFTNTEGVSACDDELPVYGVGSDSAKCAKCGETLKFFAPEPY